MNLADHFEPMEPPRHGLQTVRRRARRRAVVAHLSKAGALLVAVFTIAIIPVGLTNFFYAAGTEVSEPGQYSAPAPAQAPAQDGRSSVPGITLEPGTDRSPGAPVFSSYYSSAWWAVPLAVGFMLVLGAALFGGLRSNPPVTRLRWWAWVAFVLGGLLIVPSLFALLA